MLNRYDWFLFVSFSMVWLSGLGSGYVLWHQPRCKREKTLRPGNHQFIYIQRAGSFLLQKNRPEKELQGYSKSDLSITLSVCFAIGGEGNPQWFMQSQSQRKSGVQPPCRVERVGSLKLMPYTSCRNSLGTAALALNSDFLVGLKTFTSLSSRSTKSSIFRKA